MMKTLTSYGCAALCGLILAMGSSARADVMNRELAQAEKVTVQGITFVRLNGTAVLRPGQTYELTNVIFRSEAPAMAAIIAQSHGDLSLGVYDSNTGGLIGRGSDSRGDALVQWTPRYTGPFTLRVTNHGQSTEQFYIVGNWAPVYPDTVPTGF